MIDYIAMGKRIRRYREKKRWLQADLAYEVKMSNTTISHIEGGSGRPELNTVVNIANALGVTVDMLLCDSLTESRRPYEEDLGELFGDCTPEEIRMLSEMIPPILSSYRRSVKKAIE